jgi:hypothetical protein
MPAGDGKLLPFFYGVHRLAESNRFLGFIAQSSLYLLSWYGGAITALSLVVTLVRVGVEAGWEQDLEPGVPGHRDLRHSGL